MLHRLASVLAVLLLLGGCANLTQALPPTAQPEADSAYVAGLFSRSKGMNFAFVIRSLDGKAEYVMPMGEDSALPTQVSDSSVAIKVRPGSYAISEWIAYATLTKEVVSRKPVGETPLSHPFTVDAGGVTHLGNFAMGSRTSNEGYMAGVITIRVDMQIRPVHTTQRAVHAAFAQAYPQLGSQPFACLFCTDTFTGQTQ